MRRAALALVIAAIAAPGATASITVATNAQGGALRVDARGNAEVSWSAGGVRHTLLVPPRGRVYPGRHLAGPDVSRATSEVALPYLRTLRRTPDGRLWALQAWRVQPAGPLELHFARWKGAPTQVTLAAEPASGSERLVGQATFQGRPVAGFSPTPEGKRVRIYAFLDALADGWKRLAGVATKPDGSFALFVGPEAKAESYRVSLAGPNLGTTYAPDATATATTAVP